jgi:DNA-directed RNA polymerase alpha subunit
MNRLDSRIEDLDLPTRVKTVLRNAGCETLRDVVQKYRTPAWVLLKCRGFGGKSLRVFVTKLEELGVCENWQWRISED